MNSEAYSRVMASLKPGPHFEPFERIWHRRSLCKRFERQVNRFPDKLAVRSRHQSYTYSRMNQIANNLARETMTYAGEGVEVIGLLLADPVKMITAMYGVLKTGRPFVPLDPSYPVSRIAYMIENAGAGIIVTDQGQQYLAEYFDIHDGIILNYDEIKNGPPSGNLNLNIFPDVPMSIMYTSGSTGNPKGVVRNQSDRLLSADRQINGYYLSPDDRCALLVSTSFGASSLPIHPTLLAGASIHAYSLKQEGVSALADWLRSERITRAQFTPSLFRNFAEFLTEEDEFPQLQWLMLGGEATLASDVHLFKKYSLKMVQFCASLLPQPRRGW